MAKQTKGTNPAPKGITIAITYEDGTTDAYVLNRGHIGQVVICVNGTTANTAINLEKLIKSQD